MVNNSEYDGGQAYADSGHVFILREVSVSLLNTTAVMPTAWILAQYSTRQVQSPESMVPFVNYAVRGMSLLETSSFFLSTWGLYYE